MFTSLRKSLVPEVVKKSSTTVNFSQIINKHTRSIRPWYNRHRDWQLAFNKQQRRKIFKYSKADSWKMLWCFKVLKGFRYTRYNRDVGEWCLIVLCSVSGRLSFAPSLVKTDGNCLFVTTETYEHALYELNVAHTSMSHWWGPSWNMDQWHGTPIIKLT